MHFSNIAIATLATVGPLANAHGSGLPQIIGLDTADVKTRTFLRSLGARLAESQNHEIEARQTPPTPESPPECGPGIGSCPDNKCCSISGFCGTTEKYCYSPGCKYQYGPGCAENNPPSGSNTSSIPRDKLGSVPYGGNGIFHCTKTGTVALTYDDGPQTEYTERILDLLKSYNAKATFFMTGANINKGRIDEKHADTIKRVDAEGHQVASHTWTHLDLSKISAVDRKNQMWMNEMAIRNVLGKIPTYMRPPYSSCTADSGCQQDMADLGYHISYFNVDTDDYNRNNASQIQLSKDKFKAGITNSSAISAAKDKWLTIGHDILDQTANNLTEYMLKTLQDLGYKAVTMGECLGDSKKNWYRGEDGKGVGNDTEPANSTDSNGAQPSGSSGSGSGSGSGTGSSSASASPPAATGAASVVSASSVSAIMLMFSVAFAYVM